MIYKTYKFISIILLGLSVTSCGGGGDNSQTNNNLSPSVDAGTDQTISSPKEVILNGIASDPDGSIASYLWEQVSGPSVQLENNNTKTAKFTVENIEQEQTLEFKLTVKDNKGAESTDTVKIIISITSPISSGISAGADQTVNGGEEVSLDGLIEGESSTFSYSWEQLSGPAVVINNSDSLTATFVSPKSEVVNTLEFKLTVTTPQGLEVSDTTNVTVSRYDFLPLADAGPDQTVNENAQVNLSALGIDDADSLSILWEQISGTPINIPEPTNQSISFTAPDVSSSEELELKLTLSNGTDQSADIVKIIVENTNNAPVADSGVSQFVKSDTLVELDASKSSDDQGLSNLAYSWRQVDNSGVIIQINNSEESLANFSAPIVEAATTFSFQVTVKDEQGLTDLSNVNIAVSPTIADKLNDTGLLECAPKQDSNGEALANCEDTYGEDAQLGRDVTSSFALDGKAGFSFTKLDVNGNPLPHDSQIWSCVLDNVTGLIWEVKTDDNGLHSSNHTYSWFNPDSSMNNGNSGIENEGVCSIQSCDTNAYVSEVNEQSFCGKSNWRLPNRSELISIRDFSITVSDNISSIDTDYFPSNSSETPYWTSTQSFTSLNNGSHAVSVYFSAPFDFGGEFSLDNFIIGKNKVSSNHIRLVAE